MKNLFYFIVGVLFITLISATTVSVMTVKPQIPKTTLVKTFYAENNSEYVAKYIKEMIRKGYQYRDCQGANAGQYYSTWIVVMEKY